MEQRRSRLAAAALATALVLGTGGCVREARSAEASAPSTIAQVATAPVAVMKTSSPTPTQPRPTPTRSTVTPRPTRTAQPDTCAQIRCVALTFDDGPGRDTGRLLDILRERQVRATFFMLGERAAQYPAMVRRVQAEGHVIGNHTQDHRRLSGLSPAGQRREVTRAAAAIRAAGGSTPRLFRPPYGSHNAATRRLGLPLVLWDVDSQDWRSKNAAKVHTTVMREVRPGSIILLHDIHPTTVDAVASLITDLQGAGYALVTVPQLLGGTVRVGSVVTRRDH